MNHPGIIVNSRANWRQFLPRTVLETVAYLFWVSLGLALIGLLYWGGAVAQDLMGVER